MKEKKVSVCTKLSKIAFAFGLLGCFYGTSVYAQSEQVCLVIPRPQSVCVHHGQFVLKPSTSIYIGSPKTLEAASLLTRWINKQTDKQIVTTKLLKPAGQIRLEINPALDREGYLIRIDSLNVVCQAADKDGLFYAVETLEQSLQKGSQLAFPSMTINDSPRFAWRGVMLDDSRHFFGKAVVEQILDVMAHLKLNTFHMHLTDETGWRIEIKKYPKLTTIGAEGNWSDRKAPARFYTQQDIREIVHYAAQRHIMVIPEIDMPGHASAATKAYPEVSDGTGKGREYGFTFHPTQEATYRFLDNVLTEVARLFPAPYIHIGGDEVAFGIDVWKRDPKMQQFIKQHNLGDVNGLEHYFIRRMADIVHRKGKTMIGWDEIVPSGVTPDQAVIMWWRHDQQGLLKEALNKGFNVILTPRLPCYFDFIQDDCQKIGRRWQGHYNTLDTTYQFPDNLSSLTFGHRSQIMGLQASLWTERIATKQRLYYMLFPRLAAISEDAWTSNERKDTTSFKNRIPVFLHYLDEKKINYFNPFDKASTPEPSGPTRQDILSEG